jgi:glycerol-3-phosphate cytidylyltransferase-like family protein
LPHQSHWQTLREAKQRGKPNTACGMKFDCQNRTQRKRERHV